MKCRGFLLGQSFEKQLHTLANQSNVSRLHCFGEKTLGDRFHFLVGILFLIRSRRSPLRLRTNGKQSAQQTNEICSGSNDLFWLKVFVEGFALHGDWTAFAAKEFKDLIDLVEPKSQFALF